MSRWLITALALQRRPQSFLFALLLILHSLLLRAETIKIVGDEYEKPRIYLEDAHPQGILIDIIKYIEQQSDLDFSIKLFPWARAYSIAEAGEAGIIGLSKTPERLLTFDYSIPVYYEELIVVTHKNNKLEFETISDLYGKVIGVVRGGVYGEAFEQARAQGKLEVSEDNNTEQRLLRLLNRRIDVALVGSGTPGFNHVVKSNPALLKHLDQFYIATKPLARDPNYIGFSKSMAAEAFIEEINKVIRKGLQSGELDQIIKHGAN